MRTSTQSERRRFEIRTPFGRIPLLIAALLIFAVSVTNGVTSPITNSTVQSLNGFTIHATGNFVVTEIGVLPIGTSSPGTSSCTWTAFGICNAFLTGTNWVDFANVTIVNLPASTTTYTIYNAGFTSFSTASGLTSCSNPSPTTCQKISFSVNPTTASKNTFMIFDFDAGTTDLGSIANTVFVIQ